MNMKQVLPGFTAEISLGSTLRRYAHRGHYRIGDGKNTGGNPSAFLMVSTQITMANETGDCLADCRDSYYDCVDDCRENAPGNPDCYDDCSRSREECDRDCYSS